MEQYHVVLESQLGPREGTLRLEERNGIMTGAITLLGCETLLSANGLGTMRFGSPIICIHKSAIFPAFPYLKWTGISLPGFCKVAGR